MNQQPNLRLNVCNISLLLFLGIASTSHAALIVVDTHSDGTGPANACELRDAIAAANTNAVVDGCSAGNGDDRIEFNFSVPAFGITLNSDLPQITEALEIAGPGSDKLYIDGDDNHKILNANFILGTFKLQGIHLYQGFGSTGGCLQLQGIQTVLVEDVRIESCATDSGNGGGAYVSSSGSVSGVTFRRVSFINNRSIGDAGGLRVASTNVVIEDCTFSENTTGSIGSGGALTFGLPGPATVRRSTFWNNSAARKGTAIHAFAAAVEVTIENSTISNNNLTGTQSGDTGGAINSIGQISISNTVVAGNNESNSFHSTTDISNADGGAIISQGYNLIGKNEGAATEFPAGIQANGDRVGTAASPVDSDLGTLADNGGSTFTAMPNPGSPVIDNGSCPGEVGDQRAYLNLSTGFRPVNVQGISNADDACDIGAVEYMAQPPEPLFEDGFESL